jgi:hypothetical protein
MKLLNTQRQVAKLGINVSIDQKINYFKTKESFQLVKDQRTSNFMAYRKGGSQWN